MSNLKPVEYALYELMSQLSEATWCAGWMEGCEYLIWQWVGAADPDHRCAELVAAIKELSELSDRWIIWQKSHGPVAVTRDQFAAMHAHHFG